MVSQKNVFSRFVIFLTVPKTNVQTGYGECNMFFLSFFSVVFFCFNFLSLGSAQNERVRTMATSTYRIHCLTSPTGMCFCFLTDLKHLDLGNELDQIYLAYSELVVQNYAITNFNQHLDHEICPEFLGFTESIIEKFNRSSKKTTPSPGQERKKKNWWVFFFFFFLI